MISAKAITLKSQIFVLLKNTDRYYTIISEAYSTNFTTTAHHYYNYYYRGETSIHFYAYISIFFNIISDLIVKSEQYETEHK